MNKECIINRLYKTKNGEVCVSFKFKINEISVEEEGVLWSLWNQGTPLSLGMPQIFQDDNPHADDR